MGVRSWLYWIDRALAGDRCPLIVLATWLAMLLIIVAAYHLSH